MIPVDVVHAFTAREPAQQVSLVLRPCQDVTFIQIVRHVSEHTSTTPDNPRASGTERRDLRRAQSRLRQYLRRVLTKLRCAMMNARWRRGEACRRPRLPQPPGHRMLR